MQAVAERVRYRANRNFHCGALTAAISIGAIIEINGDVIKINGRRVGNVVGDNVDEAIRQFEAVAQNDKKFLERLPELEPGLPVKTETLTVLPILGCLRAAEDWLGRPLAWDGKSDKQREFLDLFLPGMPNVDGMREGELRRIADANIGPINHWLKENGFDIELSAEPGPGGFCVVSILDVLVEWIQKGSKAHVQNDKGTFDAVKLSRDKGVAIRQNPHVHNHPVAVIMTQSGDRVYMTPVDDMPDEDFPVMSKIRSLQTLEHTDHRYEGVVFPMVKYDQNIDIDFLKGLSTSTVAPGFFVQEAVQQTKFRMNLDGARVESAAAMSFRCLSRGASTPPLVIDQPFLLWIEREGLNVPIFGGVFAEDVWENPGGLD